jgi:hypothetical protein
LRIHWTLLDIGYAFFRQACHGSVSFFHYSAGSSGAAIASDVCG